jgi:hypothetical protein
MKTVFALSFLAFSTATVSFADARLVATSSSNHHHRQALEDPSSAETTFDLDGCFQSCYDEQLKCLESCGDDMDYCGNNCGMAHDNCRDMGCKYQQQQQLQQQQQKEDDSSPKFSKN